MDPVQVTPRKRKVGEAPLTPQSNRRTRGKGAPAPNPPLAPFPTPPSSRSRKTDLAITEPDLLPELSQSSSSNFEQAKPLPTHLQTLLTLHHAFNLALSLHIATKPPVLPPHPPSTTRLQLPCLTNYLAIRETVERTGGKRFSAQDLGRLAWLWQWDGKTLPKDSSAEDDENPFIVKRTTPPTSGSDEDVVSAMSYLITPTRTLDPSGKRVGTYGLGIELDLKPGETRQMLHNGAEGGLGNKGQGGGMGAVGRWNNHGEERRERIREKLDKWVELHGGYEPPTTTGDITLANTAYPTPSTGSSSTTGRSSIPPIPLLRLPMLAMRTTLLPGAPISSSPSSSNTPSSSSVYSSSVPSSAYRTAGSGSVGSGSTGSLASGLQTPSTRSSGPSNSSSSSRLLFTTRPGPQSHGNVDDPFAIDGAAVEIKPAPKPGSIEARRQAMQDRIRQRKESSRSQPSLSESVNGGYKVNMAGLSAAARQQELQRRATLSRLESVAEAVWMKFSAPGTQSGSGSMSITMTPPSASRRKTLRLDEMAEVVVKSSKTPISHAEAESSLIMLTELCPFFLTKKVVSKVDYLEMPSQVQHQVPPAFSPGTNSTVAGTDEASAAVPSPASRSTRASTPPNRGPAAGMGITSPSPRARARLGAGNEIAGPASPGRVRRNGGLREVRERIRKELDVGEWL